MREIYTKETFNERNLSQLPLFRLRIIGREVGVKSPTSLKKNQLINEIIEVVNGKKLPHKNAKGRPINYDVDISRGNKFCRDSIIEREISLLKKRIKKEQDDFLERIKEIIVDFEKQIKL